MPILHKILLGVEIYAIAATSLVVLSWVFATIRAITEKVKPVFNYPADVPKAEAQAATEKYPHRAVVGLDIFCNVFFLFGRQCETMSTHAWAASKEGKFWGKAMNAWLNGFQPNHGPQAASGDLQRTSAEVERLKGLLGIK